MWKLNANGKRFILWKKLQWNSVTAINIKMINFDDYVNANKTRHNKHWPYIPDHPYRILINGGSGSRKTNLLLDLMENHTIRFNRKTTRRW